MYPVVKTTKKAIKDNLPLGRLQAFMALKFTYGMVLSPGVHPPVYFFI
jgi:hypothetical protein